ncbi:hypothetical protein [Bordetella avium]|nr:hypothetical protein [Bordetella avium]WQE33795.1 hypothetical protein U0029_01020 [Bordetella avium]SUV67363.1 Uncharacterised protein [Bordetella avium]
MRETYDCAVVLVPGHGSWLDDWMRHVSTYSMRNGYPRLFAQLPEGASATPGWLKSSALSLRRFDACLLPVEAATLPWVRTALAGAQGSLETPVLALVTGVGSVGLRDLLPLGLDDFLSPDSPDELRLRVALSICRRNRQTPREAWVYDVKDDAFQEQPSLNEADLDASLLDAPFGAAKARVVGHFERTYLHCCLAKHEGNVSQAARAALKHRRAFWALMRKHRIQAAPYREHARERASLRT